MDTTKRRTKSEIDKSFKELLLRRRSMDLQRDDGHSDDLLPFLGFVMVDGRPIRDER